MEPALSETAIQVARAMQERRERIANTTDMLANQKASMKIDAFYLVDNSSLSRTLIAEFAGVSRVTLAKWLLQREYQ